jgi:hypothetical protein
VLAFLSMTAIEKYLQACGYYQQRMCDEHEIVNRMTKEIKSSSTWERRGVLKKKSNDSNAFKDRYFSLEQDFLVYYKSEKDKQKEDNFSTSFIHLGSANIRMI